jgi:two-component system, NtrC family, nitrogen regulation sensor histidine kinase NtrY
MGSRPAATEATKRTSISSRRTRFERRVIGFITFLVLPGLLVTALLVWLLPWSTEARLAVVGAELLSCLLIGAALHEHIIRPLQTLANVVGALREEDYSFRARNAVPNDALGELSLELNGLADLLSRHRTGAIEATALLERVVEEVDIPIFAFDPSAALRLVNPAGEKLLHRNSAQLLGSPASQLGLENCLSCENETLVSLAFASGARWFVRRSSFRQQGMPHTLVVLSDVSRALREEERRAWQRLIRVIGHELNNSLAPIKSIAGSLNARLEEANLDSSQRQDFERGLGIIETRAASLNRFLQAYRQLAQMPPPVPRDCSVAELVGRAVALETRVAVSIVTRSDVSLRADPDQLEQMLINLLQNAAEAVLEQQSNGDRSTETIGSGNELEPRITVQWARTQNELVLTIEDNGPGLMNPSNAFVPFYTTKPQGSGIGLVLSRQIAEAHGGSLELSNRIGQRGCVVKVRLPTMIHPPDS